MANPEHSKKLREGVEVWNKWREEHREIIPDLSAADLNRADLGGANLIKANLREAELSLANVCRADLREADLSGANLSESNLNSANLSEADCRWANLRGTNLSQTNLAGAKFEGANLSGADVTLAALNRADFSWAKLRSTKLSRTDLSAVDLSRADLSGADISEADLWHTVFGFGSMEGVNFAGCRIRGATFADVDLSQALGLDALEHIGPSTIGLDTIYRSQGKIPEIFLRGAGVPENFITYMRSLAAQPFDYYSCFISYSSQDHDFAERLHSDLQAKGVRCWFAPEDLKIGDKFRQRIDEAIRIYDKLLVVLSENSIQSSWVEEEVEGALEKERRENKLVLFPIRLDGAVMETNQAWAASLRRTRHIADFTKWKEHDHYQSVFQRLLRDLQGKNVKGAGEEA